MDSYEYSELLKSLRIKCENIAKIIDPCALKARLDEIATLEMSEEYWHDSEKQRAINMEKKALTLKLDRYKEALAAIDEASEIFHEFGHDAELVSELFCAAPSLRDSVAKLEVEMMLAGEHDICSAIVSITPGAGGTESCDFAAMLYRMYLRWSERRGYKIELLDYQDGDEAGIKGVTFIIKGERAYGYMKVENGVHRLVRISPFDANAKRHTSFASVLVTPELDSDIIIDIEDKDLRIDTYRSSGAGGQHVNKTESAIRITHIPTGIVVQCQNDRSQHKNKASALKTLASRLYAYEKERQDAAKNSVDKSDIGFGHQIRSYVLAPYQSIKDTRSPINFTNTSAILDGDLDALMQSVLTSAS